MRCLALLVFFATMLLGEAAIFSGARTGSAQAQNSAQEKAASLRAQLSEVETKQAELQTRLQRLEEDSKPENIEKSLAGVGSTKPEELREQRRRQFEIERNGLQAQLNLLATSHTRLETAIAQADAEAYRQSAAPVTASTTTNLPATTASTGAATTSASTPPRRIRKKKAMRSKRAVTKTS